ncbi:MAG: site-specific DNA-methyltransferase [Ruminococcaceae bacterium]|nr:site-specific DNA-methyltransferase [Oscillospiraceae bacterium]
MEKMRMESLDMTSQNIEKIGALFPNCITEAIDENGKAKKAINFELLKQMLSGDVIEGNEAYEFTWVGKKAAIVEANKPIRKTLRPCKEESVNWDTTENLYIEGDNLEVLKLLQESYLSAIKMIYIDPPYNTGSDFIYPDSFIMDNEDYETGTGYFDENGNINFSRENSATQGRYHSDWCSLLYSRLILARNLLSEDGIIFMSIDDNELFNLIKIGQEVFGTNNYIATFVWEKRKTRENRKIVSVRHDYIVCFVKNYDNRANAIGLEEMDDTAIERYKNPDNDPRGVWTSVPAIAQAGHGTKSQFYTITSPSGKHFDPPSGSCWRYTKEKMDEAIADNRIWFGSDGNGVPRIKKFITDGKQGLTPETILFADKTGTNDSAKRELVSLFDGVAVFETPKPTSLIKHLVNICNNSNDGIFLDFFSGTATTAHAVIQKNAEDGGRRKFILVQLPEPCGEHSEAYKNSYKNICEIGKERIRRAGAKIREESPLTAQNLDIGFRVFILDETNMNDVYYSADEYSQRMLSMLESNVKADRTDLDLLFGCLLEWGLPLSLPYTSETIEGCTVHTYNDGDLIACFDENIPDSVIKTIAKKQPLRAVFRDSSFANSPSKINVYEVFKLLAPDTRVKVI